MNFKRIIALIITVCLLAIILCIPAFAFGIERDGSDCAFFGDVLVPFTYDELPFSVSDYPYFTFTPVTHADGIFPNRLRYLYSAFPLTQTDDGYSFTGDVYGGFYLYDDDEFYPQNVGNYAYPSVYYYSGEIDGINSNYRAIDANTVTFCDYYDTSDMFVQNGIEYHIQSSYVDVSSASCYCIDYPSGSFSFRTTDDGWEIYSNDLRLPVVIASESYDTIHSAYIPDRMLSVTSFWYESDYDSVLESINYFVSSAMAWVGSFISSIVGNPIIFIFCICSLIGLGIGLFSRLKR